MENIKCSNAFISTAELCLYYMTSLAIIIPVHGVMLTV
jgi:hypothetical protein